MLWDEEIGSRRNDLKQLRGEDLIKIVVECIGHAFDRKLGQYEGAIPDGQLSVAKEARRVLSDVVAKRAAAATLNQMLDGLKEIYPDEDADEAFVSGWGYSVQSLLEASALALQGSNVSVESALRVLDAAYQAVAEEVITKAMVKWHGLGESEITAEERRSQTCNEEIEFQRQRIISSVIKGSQR